jgi:hypothetical protein
MPLRLSPVPNALATPTSDEPHEQPDPDAETNEQPDSSADAVAKALPMIDSVSRQGEDAADGDDTDDSGNEVFEAVADKVVDPLPDEALSPPVHAVTLGTR